jgi:hypothetical protein
MKKTEFEKNLETVCGFTKLFPTLSTIRISDEKIRIFPLFPLFTQMLICVASRNATYLI